MMTIWDMWQHCNKSLHKSDENRQAIVEADINQQLRQAFKQASIALPPAAKQLMQRLQFPATYKCQWIPYVLSSLPSKQPTNPITCKIVQQLSADLATPNDRK